MGRAFSETRNDRLVIFGRPWREVLPEQVERFGWRRVAVIASPRRTGLAEGALAALGASGVGVVGLARRHVPREVVDAAGRELERLGADAVVTIGGGSVIGLGKAVQLERVRGLVAVPTTYSGSEMTSIYGIREGGQKLVARDPRVAPGVVVYDPDLTLALPLSVSLPSLFNAMAHAVDALYARGVTPEIESRAGASVAEIAGAIAELAAAPDDPGVRSRALHGAYLAAAILGSAGMALHHKLAHVVAGGLDLPHAETHTVLLPHVVAFNAGAAPRATGVLQRALRTDDPAAALYDLAERVGAPTRLDRLGLDAEAVPDAAQTLAAATFDNPRRPTADEAAALLDDARAGRRPSIRAPR